MKQLIKNARRRKELYDKAIAYVPEAAAKEFKELYSQLAEQVIGVLIPYNSKWIWQGQVVIARQDIYFFAQYNPDNAPNLWIKDNSDIEDGYPIWSKELANLGQYKTQGEILWHHNKLWENMHTDGLPNVWEPGSPGVDDRIWQERVDLKAD